MSKVTQPWKQKCSELNTRGLPCGSWAVRGEETCYLHSLDDESRESFTRRGSARSIVVRQERAAARQQGSNRHRVDSTTLSVACEAMRRLLTGTLDGAEPNLEQRALGLSLFGIIYRQPSREDSWELLNRAAPGLARGVDLKCNGQVQGRSEEARRGREGRPG